MRLFATMIGATLGLALMSAGYAVGQDTAATVAAFVPGVGDLPLMAGLDVDPEATMVFDKPDGRIVEASATGALSPEAVLAFYATTLPQLGWLREAPTRFTREGEVLRLAIEPPARPGARLRLNFSIEPQ